MAYICTYTPIYLKKKTENEWEHKIYMFYPLLFPCIISSWGSFPIGINPSANLSQNCPLPCPPVGAHCPWGHMLTQGAGERDAGACPSSHMVFSPPPSALPPPILDGPLWSASPACSPDAEHCWRSKSQGSTTHSCSQP